MFLSLYLSSSLLLSFCWSGHVFSSLWSNVSKAKNLSLGVFSKCICHRHCICLRLCCCLFVGQVMFSHRSDQMSQRPKVSKIALWRCSLNVFVIVIVFLFVFVFVVIFLLVSLLVNDTCPQSRITNISYHIISLASTSRHWGQCLASMSRRRWGQTTLRPDMYR